MSGQLKPRLWGGIYRAVYQPHHRGIQGRLYRGRCVGRCISRAHTGGHTYAHARARSESFERTNETNEREQARLEAFVYKASETFLKTRHHKTHDHVIMVSWSFKINRKNNRPWSRGLPGGQREAVLFL